MQSAIDGVQQRLASVTAMDSAVTFRVCLWLLAQIGLQEDARERNRQRHFHLWPVKSRIDMQTPMRHTAARLEYKRTQLLDMMAYCGSTDCRCQQIRDHFGDPEPPLATTCCDHCEPLRSASRPRRRAPASTRGRS